MPFNIIEHFQDIIGKQHHGSGNNGVTGTNAIVIYSERI